MSSSNPIHESPTPTGRVEIADSAIISVIHEAVLGCYGVVELGTRSLQSPLRRRFFGHDASRGISISQEEEDHLQIELSIVVEYGTPIFTVAQNVMQTVKFQVERLLALTVDRVNVNVDGLRVSTLTEKTS